MREGGEAKAPPPRFTLADEDLAALAQKGGAAQTSTSAASCASTATCASRTSSAFLKGLV